MSVSTEHVPNIGARGARRRRAGGYFWLLAGSILAAAGLLQDASPALLAVLVIPFSLAALGLLQAREKT